MIYFYKVRSGMQSLRQDVRYGMRLIKQRPGFAAVTVITLALGIGANTAIFSLLDALVLRNLSVWRPDRLVEVAGIYRNGAQVPFSFPVFQQLQENQRVFSNLFGWTTASRYNVEVEGTLFLGGVRGVTGNYYSALGAAPLLGRFIGPEDAASSPGAPVAVIGYEFWERRFGRDPAVIGKLIRIEGAPFTIVGVSRKWFMGMTPGAPPEITVPVTAGPFADLSTNRALLWIFATGRLKDGFTIEQARAQLRSFWPEALVATAPTALPGQRLQSWLNMRLDMNSAARGLNDDLRRHFERPLQVLMGLAGLILLVACVNLANLTLARVVARSREMCVRVALGATRLQIVRQLLTENILLSSAGALLALAFASWGGHMLAAMIGEGADTPVILDLRPDWRVFCFAVLAAVGTGVLIVLAPAWHMSRQKPADVLRADGRTLASGTGRLSKLLIVTQIALSLVLLFGAGLLLQTFERLRSFDPQFQRKSVIQVSLNPRPEGFKDVDTNTYRKQLVDAVATLPGVVAASFADLDIPAGDTVWTDTVSLAAVDSGADATRVARLVTVSPGFFQTLGIPIISGRSFDWTDDERHPRVAIIDRNLARRLLPSGDALGTRVRFGVQPELQELQVVGVTRSARLINLRDPDALVIYIPSPQQPRFSESGNLFVRVENTAGIARAVQNEIQSHGHEYSISAKTLEEASDQTLVEERATAMLSSLFGALALSLASIGLFGLMSYTVTRRTREIGIRMALGSQRTAILRLVMRESLLLSVAGLLIGAPCAIAATRLIAHMLFGITPGDPLTFAVAASLLLAVGAVAGYWPARRATRIDPMVALRCE
jgi:predicted permease